MSVRCINCGRDHHPVEEQEAEIARRIAGLVGDLDELFEGLEPEAAHHLVSVVAGVLEGAGRALGSSGAADTAFASTVACTVVLASPLVEHHRPWREALKRLGKLSWVAV